MVGALVELRQCVRSLVRAPAFTIAAILTLALGIGATTAMFSVVNAVILEPLRFTDPGRLVRLFQSSPSRGLDFFSVSVPNYLDWKTQSRSFVGLASWERQREVTAESGSAAQVVLASRVEPSLFDVLGVSPSAGRLFATRAADSDETSAVISYALWQRLFGGAASALGATVQLDGVPYGVVGVLPSGFDLTGNPAEIFTPLVLSPGDARDRRFLRVIGRMRAGVSEAAALADIRRVSATLATEYPETNSGWTANSTSLNELAVGRGYRRAVLILLTVSGLVLLIACANVANLILVRNTAREHEIAVRAALGASTTRLAAYQLLESTLLTAAGAALGLLTCIWLIDLAKVSGPIGVPKLTDIAVDARVLGFTLATAALVATLGLLPALHSARRTMQPVLRWGRGLIGTGSGDVNAWLVAGQVTLTVVLLVPAALLVQSFVHLQRVEPGFQPAGLAALRVSLPEGRYPTPERGEAFYAALLEQLHALPGVRSVAASTGAPFFDSNTGNVFAIEGAPIPGGAPAPDADRRVVSPEYFRTMGIPMVAGRAFERSEVEDVVIISDRLARRYWSDASPLGARLRIGDLEAGPVHTVVGVVGDVRYYELEGQEIRPMMYFPLSRQPARALTLIVHTDRHGAGALEELRSAVQALDHLLPPPEVQLLTAVLQDEKAQRRFNAWVLAVFAALALVLALIGIYGITAYAVSRRVREIGLRIALGASARSVVLQFVSRGMSRVLLGAAAGAAASFAAARLLSGLVFGVEPADPLTLAGVPLSLLLIALVATWLPARRAARIDPMVTLRQQ